ncbi:hypothetical protein [Acetivibrio clariflavus]|uniref:DUF7847 domain-containing protein n=1 Tax=Acetivibrio clariflavus (strain DSM 19732 / NBRC 101661 / EBR45) TaxID=720554 RepID=G8LUC9_ACECE|nr:hypothetical protein [Acetivibrio clariflavus]AEV69561.1 hypothetical protein Clocl_3026 [Acetivibrio clariflavus DSM 19732]
MKYLENAFKFLGNFFLLVIPLFIAIAIPSIISGPSKDALSKQYTEIIMTMAKDPTLMQNSSNLIELFSTLISFLPPIILGFILTIILRIIVNPATYGMVNKALETGNVDLNDFVPEMKNNIGKYILYALSYIGIYFAIFFLSAILSFIFSSITTISTTLGITLLILFSIALFIGLFVFSYLISLWFPAMVSDNLGVGDGLKKSISVVKSYFWPIVGISILVAIGSGILSAIAGFLKGIPVLGHVVLSFISALVEFIMIVFCFEVYRDKTGKNEGMNEELNYEAPGDYL